MSNNNKGCLVGLFPFLKSFFKDSEEREYLPYAKRDDFLSFSEASFYKVLHLVLNSEVMICPKVGLKEIFFVNLKDKSDFRTYHNKIDRKHVDFLLCNVKDMKPICGIELDDTSHKRADRVARDRFVNELFEATGVPLLRFENKRNYTISEVKEKLNTVICMKKDDEKIQEYSKVLGEVKTPVCSKCFIPMVEREVKQGKNKGNKFWGCTNYPKCRQTQEIIN